MFRAPQCFTILCDQLLDDDDYDYDDDDVVGTWNWPLATVFGAFCRPYLPKVFETDSFLRSLCETELSLKSRAPFVDLIFQKCSATDSFFLTIFIWNRVLATVLRTFCRQRETETLLRRARQPLYPRNRLLCPRAFQACIKTRSRSLTLPNYFMLLWLPWWLRWWGGCHGGFCRPQLPKVLRDWQCVLRFWICVKSSSCYSLVRLLPSSSFQKCSATDSFWRFHDFMYSTTWW